MQDPFVDRYYVSHDGLKLHYRDYPGPHGGVPVVCLAGLTRNCRDFEDLAGQLHKRRRVICPDLRGRGQSDHDPNWKNYHPGTYVADVWKLLDELGLNHVAVIGTSLGGLMAMVMVSQAAQRIAGVVLNDVGPEIAPEGLARIRGYVGELPPVASWDDAVAQAKQVYGDALPDLSDEEWLRFTIRGFRENEEGVPVLDMDPKIGDAVRADSGQAGDPWALWHELRVPTLALRGEHSDILSKEIFARMRKEKPDLVAIEVRNRGHVPLLDEPDAIDAIEAFLDNLDQARR
jgi:pimeloyl-ACP methyl ester carboxylesterase